MPLLLSLLELQTFDDRWSDTLAFERSAAQACKRVLEAKIGFTAEK